MLEVGDSPLLHRTVQLPSPDLTVQGQSPRCSLALAYLAGHKLTVYTQRSMYLYYVRGVLEVTRGTLGTH